MPNHLFSKFYTFPPEFLTFLLNKTWQRQDDLRACHHTVITSQRITHIGEDEPCYHQDDLFISHLLTVRPTNLFPASLF